MSIAASVEAPRRRFPRRQRLVKASEFQSVFDQPRRSSAGGLTVLTRRNDLGQPRLGLVVSRKCARRAVDRNRIKRVIRDSFRCNQARLGAWDIVVIGRPGIEQRANSEIAAALEQHWVRLRPCAKS